MMKFGAITGKVPISMKFGEGCPRIFEMVPDIEEDQVGDGKILEAKRVGVFNLIQPRVRKNVGRESFRDDRLEIADAGPDLDGLTRQIAP